MGRRARLVGLLAVGLCATVVFITPALATQSEAIHGKITGRFASASSCFGCGEMVSYVRADTVWCGWQGENVIIHVRFRNSSIAHLTISWHPSYDVRGGGSHGDGFSSIQESGVNAHASRGVFVKQKPKGIPAGSPLASCKPSFFSVKTG